MQAEGPVELPEVLNAPVNLAHPETISEMKESEEESPMNQAQQIRKVTFAGNSSQQDCFTIQNS